MDLYCTSGELAFDESMASHHLHRFIARPALQSEVAA